MISNSLDFRIESGIIIHINSNENYRKECTIWSELKFGVPEILTVTLIISDTLVILVILVTLVTIVTTNSTHYQVNLSEDQ
jgi:hypothetical protein